MAGFILIIKMKLKLGIWLFQKIYRVLVLVNKFLIYLKKMPKKIMLKE